MNANAKHRLKDLICLSGIHLCDTNTACESIMETYSDNIIQLRPACSQKFIWKQIALVYLSLLQ